MSFRVGKFQFDKATLISLVVVIALLLVGYGIGILKGQHNVQSQIIEQGGQNQSLTGKVKSTNKSGFVMTIDTSQSGGATTTTGTGNQKAPSGDWTVKYGSQGANNISVTNGSNSGTEKLAKGDKVQVNGIAIGGNTLIAQSISKVLPPTPAPSAAPQQQQQP